MLRTFKLISAGSFKGVEVTTVALVVCPTFLEELPVANSMAFLFSVSMRGISFSLPLLLAGVRGLEDGGTKKPLVNLDILTIVKARLEIYVRTNVQSQRKGKSKYLFLFLILLLLQTQARVHRLCLQLDV